MEGESQAQPLERRRGDREHQPDLHAGETAEQEGVASDATIGEPVGNEQDRHDEYDREDQLEEAARVPGREPRKDREQQDVTRDPLEVASVTHTLRLLPSPFIGVAPGTRPNRRSRP
jgi:hypothetical protein